MGYKWAEYTLVIMGVVGGALFFLSVALRGGMAARRAWEAGRRGRGGGPEERHPYRGATVAGREGLYNNGCPAWRGPGGGRRGREGGE